MEWPQPTDTGDGVAVVWQTIPTSVWDGTGWQYPTRGRSALPQRAGVLTFDAQQQLDAQRPTPNETGWERRGAGTSERLEL